MEMEKGEGKIRVNLHGISKKNFYPIYRPTLMEMEEPLDEHVYPLMHQVMMPGYLHPPLQFGWGLLPDGSSQYSGAGEQSF